MNLRRNTNRFPARLNSDFQTRQGKRLQRAQKVYSYSHPSGLKNPGMQRIRVGRLR